MVSFLLRYNRRTGDLDVTEFVGEHAREEALAARVDAEIARAMVISRYPADHELRRRLGPDRSRGRS